MNAPGPMRSAVDGAIELDVAVVPRASKSRVVGAHGERLKVQLAAPPVDGAANAELCEVLARALDVPRRAVTLLRGATGKRKTLRIAGIELDDARRRLGIALVFLAAIGAGTTACKPITTELGVQVLLPDDTTLFERTNNVSIALEPDGFVDTVEADGLDFSISFQMPPDETRRALSLYLAENETLLGWGRTPEVSLRGAQAGLSVFIARPGAFTALPGTFEAPDPDVLAAPLSDVGVLVLASDGGTLFLDAFDYETVVGSTLPDPPAATDGALVPDADHGVQRLAWAEGFAAWRYDPSLDEWSERALGEHGVQPRPDAAWVLAPGGDEVLVIGGADATDIVAIALDPEASPAVRITDAPGLDAARPGAPVVVATSDFGTTTLVFGRPAADGPVAWWLEAQQGLGPEAAWSHAGCVVVEPATGEAGPRILCAGGERDGMPTADGVELLWAAGGEPTIVEHPDLLVMPMLDPLWLVDDAAVYAQGGGRMLALAKADLTANERDAASPRDTGGALAPLPSGFVVLVGGRAADGSALPHWYVFGPEPS